MKYICPLLVVSDMKRSSKFCEEVLGQKVKADFGENVTYEGDFAIHPESHYSELIGQKTIAQGGNNFGLYFEKDDLEGVAEKGREKCKGNNEDYLHARGLCTSGHREVRVNYLQPVSYCLIVKGSCGQTIQVKNCRIGGNVLYAGYDLTVRYGIHYKDRRSCKAYREIDSGAIHIG